MATPASKNTLAIARTCVRIACAVLAALVSLTAVGAVGVLLSSFQAPGQTVSNSLGSPWVRDYGEKYEVVDAAWDSAPDAVLAVSARVEPLPSSPEAPGIRQFRVGVSITFKSPQNPIVALFRHGLDDAQISTLMLDLGAPQTPYSVLWADPVLSIKGGDATTEVIGVGGAPLDGGAIISIPPVFNCQKIESRQIVVISTGLTPTGFAVDADTKCGSSNWKSQNQTTATYNGFAQTSVTLSPPKKTSISNQMMPILGIGSNESQAARALWVGLLVSLPIFLASRLIREPQGLTTAGPVTRTGRTLRVFVVFSIIAAACPALASIAQDLFGLLSQPGGFLNSQHDYSAPYFLVPLIQVVAIAVIWRSAALRYVLKREMGLRRRALLGAFTIASLLGVTGLSYWSSQFQPGSRQIRDNGISIFSDEIVWSWLGLIALGGIVAVLGVAFACVTVLLRRPPWRTARVFLMASPAAFVLCFVILVMSAAMRFANDAFENFGYPDVALTFTGLLSSTTGIIASLAAVATAGSLLAVVATSLPWSDAGPLRIRNPGPWGGLVFLTVVFAGGCSYALLLLDPYLLLPINFLSFPPPLGTSDWSQTQFGFTVTVFATSLVFLTGIFVVMALLHARAALTMSTMAGAATLLILLVIAPLGSANGLVSTATVALITLGAGYSIWMALFRIDGHVLNAAPPPWWRKLRALRPLRGIRLLLALVLAAPVVVYNEERKFSFYDTMSLASSIARVLPLLSAIVLIVLMRYFGRVHQDGGKTVGSLSQIRLVACLTATVSLFSPTATTVGFPIAFGVGVFLVFSWLIPEPSFANIHASVGELEARTSRAEVEVLAGAVTELRTTESLARGLRKSIAESNPDSVEQDKRIARVVEISGSSGPGNSVRRQALSSYCGQTAWRRALALGWIGTLVGLPWSVLDIATILSTLSTGGPYRLVDSASALLVVGRFSIAGLILGAAYPMIRGESGLTKGLSLTVTMTAPALVITLLPTPTMESLAAAGLQALQWVVFGLVLGLVADWQAFHRFGYGWKNVRELHRMTAFTASVSTIVVAVLTAAATTVGTGAAQVFLERVLPPSPSISQSTSTPPPSGKP